LKYKRYECKLLWILQVLGASELTPSEEEEEEGIVNTT
jgi:hypothetical protein